jgi:hypothetical protein
MHSLPITSTLSSICWPLTSTCRFNIFASCSRCFSLPMAARSASCRRVNLALAASDVSAGMAAASNSSSSTWDSSVHPQHQALLHSVHARERRAGVMEVLGHVLACRHTFPSNLEGRAVGGVSQLRDVLMSLHTDASLESPLGCLNPCLMGESSTAVCQKQL